MSFLETERASPSTVAVDEQRIETWFPNDVETAEACRELAGGPG